jgi:tetratricopeptide (TPR) repeat protein
MKSSLSTALALLVALWLVRVVHAAPPEDPAARAKAHHEQAMRLFTLGKFEKAAEEFEAAYMAKPHPIFLFNIGQCYRNLGRWQETKRTFTNYLKERPDAPNRAEVEGYIAEADQELSRATPPPPAPLAMPPGGMPPQAYPPGNFPPASYYNSTLASGWDRRKIEISNDSVSEWRFCHYPKPRKKRCMGENEFIRRYHEVTGSTELDGYVTKRVNTVGVITVSTLTVIFGAMGLAGFGILDCPSLDRGCVGATIGVGSFGMAAAFLTAVIGYPLAFREPRTAHKLSETEARRYIEKYNSTVLGGRSLLITPGGLSGTF